MIIISWDDFLIENPWQKQKTSMTLGVFDGVHFGHQKLIQSLKLKDEQIPLVFTFRVNPALLTSTKAFRGNILTLNQKLKRMKNFGVKGVVLIDFSTDFSKLTGKKFFNLVEKNTRLCRVVLGENHRLGHRGETSSEEARKILEKNGVETIIEESVLINDFPISSTRIRKSILAGDLSSVPAMMGENHTIDLSGVKIGRDNREVRVKITEINQILPPPGVYRGFFERNQELFATKIILDKEKIVWEQSEKIPVTKITFSNYEREET